MPSRTRSIAACSATGAGGALGSAYAAREKPDGYTIGVLTNDISLYKPQGLAELTHMDLRPLGRATRIAAGVNVIAIAQGSSELNISLVVSQTDAPEAARRVHAAAGTSRRTRHPCTRVPIRCAVPAATTTRAC